MFIKSQTKAISYQRKIDVTLLGFHLIPLSLLSWLLEFHVMAESMRSWIPSKIYHLVFDLEQIIIMFCDHF